MLDIYANVSAIDFPEMKLVVGLWDVQDDLSKARERIGLDAMVVAKLADAQGQIRLLSQPRLSRVESTSI